MSGWRQSGLIPFNPDVVLRKICPPTLERPTTPTDTAPTLPKTPTTAHATRQLAAEVYFDSMAYNACNPNQIRQLCQSTIINATLRQKAEEEL